MTPDQAIAALDRQLAKHGQSIILRKGNTIVDQVATRGFVRGVTADDVVGSITQSDKKVTYSPTGIADGVSVEGFNSIVVDGAPRALIGKPEVIKLDDVIVRINAVVKG
jgi:hypothetical protein